MAGIISNNGVIELFYKDEKSFNNFSDISEEYFEHLKESAKRIEECLKPRYRAYALGYGKYIDTLDFLNDSHIPFDEKIILLIILRDPKLHIYNAYAANPLYKDEDIENEKDKIRKNNMVMHNIRNYRKIEHSIKSSLGFVDEKMFFYETIYVNKLLSRNEINTCIIEDNTKNLLKEVSSIRDLDMIDKEMWSKLMSASKKFFESVKKPTKEIVSNALIFQKDFFGISSIVEQIVLFILILDPNFHLITIFEEESRYDEIKRRAISELGFYEKDLIAVEKMMIEKFFPNHKTSIWEYPYKKLSC